MPLGGRPSSIVLASQIRHEKERQDKIDVSLATANLVLAGFSTTPTSILDAVAHMFTEDELETIKEEQEARRQFAIEEAQLTALRMKYNVRGSHDKDKGRN